MAFQNKEIRIPNNAELIKQLSMYERTLTKTGKQQFNAPTGEHDDYCISLMLALEGVRKRNKKTSFVID